MKVVLGLARL